MPSERTPSKITVDFTGIEVRKGGGRSDHLPEGDYLMAVEAIREKGVKDDPSRRMLTWHYKVVEPAKLKGKNIYTNTMLEKENLWALRSMLVDLLGGESKVPASKLDIPIAKIVAKHLKVGISVVDDEYKDKLTSKVVGTFPKSEWEERKAAAAGDDIDEDEEEDEDEEDAKTAATSSDDDEDLDEIDVDDV